MLIEILGVVVFSYVFLWYMKGVVERPASYEEAPSSDSERPPTPQPKSYSGVVEHPKGGKRPGDRGGVGILIEADNIVVRGCYCPPFNQPGIEIEGEAIIVVVK